jgi:hypothetical protein
VRLPREASPEFRKIYFPAVFQKFQFVSEFSKKTKFKKVINNQTTVRRFPAEMLDGGWPWKKNTNFGSCLLVAPLRQKAAAFSLATLSAFGDVLRTACLPAAFLFPLP